MTKADRDRASQSEKRERQLLERAQCYVPAAETCRQRTAGFARLMSPLAPPTSQEVAAVILQPLLC